MTHDYFILYQMSFLQYLKPCEKAIIINIIFVTLSYHKKYFVLQQDFKLNLEISIYIRDFLKSHTIRLTVNSSIFAQCDIRQPNMVVYFDWKTVIDIYVCGQCRTQFMLPNSSRRLFINMMGRSVTCTIACANEIIPNR